MQTLLARIAMAAYGQTTPEQSWRVFWGGVAMGLVLGVFVALVVAWVIIQGRPQARGRGDGPAQVTGVNIPTEVTAGARVTSLWLHKMGETP